MGRTHVGSPAKSYVTILILVGLTTYAAAAAQHSTPATGARRLHSSDAGLNSIGFDGSSSSSSGSDAAEFASELDSLPRLLQEQMDEDAAAAAQRADEAGELATPGAYGSPDGYGALESPEIDTPAGSDDGVTITSDDAISEEEPDGSTSTSDDSAVGGKTGLEAATRDPSQSVSGSSGPVDSQKNEGKVVQQLSGGQTAGIVVGVLIAAGVLAAGVFGYQKYKKNKETDYITRYRRYDGEIEMH